MSQAPLELSRDLAGRYTIERELGRGGMGTVYLATDLKHGRKVALKVMLPHLAAGVERERFQREIEIAAGLTHPHILSLHDSGVAGGQLYYVAPYIEGETLRARLAREGQLPLPEALRLAREIASALNYAHHRGLVHRDVKPENILLADGIALVADFGIAHVMFRETPETAATLAGLTNAGAIVGTPLYMAPEQAVAGRVDSRVDIYALGCVVYEMLAGQPPFAAPSAIGLIQQHLAAVPRPVTDLRPSTPAGVAAAIAKALAKAPADRQATAAQFAEALANPAIDAGPAAAATSRVPGNLPRPRTHFIGREKELAECVTLLGATRLLTITGIGGCGKTRLAIRLVESLADRFPDGVWFLDLAPLMEPEHMSLNLGSLLGVRETAGGVLTDALAAHIGSRRALLFLDNCEHLLGASAGLVDTLLSACPRLTILVTSREGLSVEGERLVALRSLAVPPAASRDLAAIEAADAVRLFVDRARMSVSDFGLTPKTAPVVAEICRRLDGIPLAIELAAVRVKVLSPEEIRTRLDDRFRLLSGGNKTALPRHQTLRATIQWSYDQLTAGEQRLLRHLSVFAGGWTLELATRLAGDDADEFEVLDLLGRLVEKSMVVVDKTSDGESRYHLLETVRQFAQERLIESGEADAARQRHHAEFLALAETAYAGRSAREDYWSTRLETEHENLRAAIETARQSGPEAYLRLAGALAWYWHVRSHFIEARGHLTEALAASEDTSARPARARALWGAADTLTWQGDVTAALPLMQQSLRMWRELGDASEVANALEGVGWTEIIGGRDREACTTFREVLKIQRDLGDPVLVNRAMVALAQTLVAVGELEEARNLSRQIIAFSKPRGDRRNEHFGLHFLADCALIEGQCAAALEHYRESLGLTWAISDRLESSFEIQGIAMCLAGLGRHHAALRFAAAGTAEFERIGCDLHILFWDRLMDRYLAMARNALGEAEAEAARLEGEALPFEDAVKEALDVSP